METLVYYSLLPDSKNLLKIQQKAFECLLGTTYDCSCDLDFELVSVRPV